MDDVVVVLGAEAGAVAAAVDLGGAAVVVCEAWREGLGASLRTGVQAAVARGARAAVVVLGDQPLLTGAAVARVLLARDPGRADAVRATYDGVPGHPTVLESSSSRAWRRCAATRAPASCCATPPPASGWWPATASGAPDDVDTPAALARLEGRDGRLSGGGSARPSRAAARRSARRARR